MFKEMKSRRLALLVAIALGGGGFLSSAQSVSAADVTGRNVTIDDTQAPSNNAEHPGGGAAFGTAAGFIKEEANSGNVTGNTLTFKNLSYTKQLYGGLTFGTGNVTGNKVFVNPATSSHHSISDGIFGGAANGGGNVEYNHAEFNGDHLNGDLVGGMTKGTGTGIVKDNTALLKSGNANAVYGGIAAAGTNGDVLHNQATIENGHTGIVYGGYADENGNVKDNIVTVKGGIMTGVEGGHSDGTGEVSGNTVNLGDGTSAMAAGYAINGTIYGGRNDSHPDKVSNNTLNVNTNATAHNIKNFSTINFNFNAYTNTTQSLLTLNDSHGTTIERLSDLKLKDVPRGSGTLIENASGLTINSYSGALKLTAEKTETIIDKQGTTKIGYNAYQFRDSTETRSEGLEVWGGRSTIGNTTTKNTVTLNGNYTGRNAYGGRTDGTGSTATGENAKNHSIENTITLDGAGSIVNNMTGGMTLSAGGNATGNRAVLKAGTVNGSLTGGSVGSSGGDVTGNFVDVNGGTVHGTTYGGYASGTGKAEHNTVTLTGGTLNSDIYGGVASSGAAMNNTVNIKGGSAANHDVYGGFSTNGNATGNTVNITGGSVRNVDGGRSLNGHATNNIVNIGSADAAFGGSITGIINGGSGTTYGNDYRTGNKLNVYGNATASNIRNFAEINFHFNAHVNQSNSFLTLSDVGGTPLHSLSDLKINGEHGHKGTLLKNTGGTITISDGGNRLVKTNENKELVLAKSSDSKRIDYEGYQFKGATNTTTVEDGANKDIFGGRSIGANTTTGNIITVSDAQTYRNVYGGWTTGSGTTATNKNDSTNNEVTVNGSASVTGTVYGGFTDVAGSKATGNKVTIEKSVTGGVVGGKAAGDASGNTVTVKANTGAVTGGDGATTNNNTVNLEGGVNVNGAVKGGTQANGTGNTLNVKGQNSAQSVEGFQKMNFNTNGVAAGGTMLNVTGAAQTKVNWNTLSASGVAIQKVTLLKNTAGYIHLEDYSGSAKSEITGGNTESNIDVVKDSSNNITDITYQGYQFKGARGNATVDGADVYGGRSKAGNTTIDNDVTVASGAHTNAYGGWTSGTGTSAADKGNSHDNTVIVKESATVSGTVYGGLTESADGKATGNTVTVEKNLDADLVGGKAAAEASGNTVNVTNATVKSVTGGDGATTNNNTVNISGGSRVTNNLAGGTAANSTGNTLNVKGKDNKAGAIANIQKMVFDASGLAKNDTMLEVTGTARTDVNWADLKATGTAAKPLTLFKNVNGINLSNYTGAAKSETTETTETNVDVRKTGNKITEITYEGYQFKGVTTAMTDGGNLYGGISKAGNSTRENTITVNSGTHTNVYGGWTSGTGSKAADKDNSHDNTVTIAGGTVTGKVYGGYTEAADGKTYNNTVNLNGGNLSNAEISGGNRTIGTEKGNTLNVNTAATVKKIDNFQTVAFKDAGSKLTLTTANANFDLDTIQANFDATANPALLVKNTSGLALKDGKTFRTELSTDGTKETNIEARESNTKIVRYGYTFKNATTVTTLGTEMWGGRSAVGNTTTGNTISVSDGRGTMTVYGGYTSGTGGTATDKNDSHTNTVTVTGGNMTVYGGWTNVGKAVSNTVNVTADAQGTLVGGYSASGEASNNVVDVRNAAFTGNITGGQGTAANYNVIRLRNASVTGTITGGLAPNAKDNTLEVSYGTGTPSSVNDFRGIQRLHFDMENAPVRNTNPLLKLTAVVGGDKNLTGMKFAVARSGATQKLEKGDTFTLMENTTAPEKKITVGSGVTAEGRDGVSRNYEFDITTDAAGKLIATVTKAGMREQSKSIVETRAGASAFLNDGADFTAGPGMDAAKKEARAAAQSGNAPYGIWAGMGGGSLRHETGSYVDMKGWNLGVGWARENAVQAGTLTFGPFIEYGRGSYDSYLDDGTHGSGKTGFLGAGVMAKIETDSHWVDGSLRVGRTKSDYMGLATYDTTSTYYGVQVGAGKDFHVNENDSVGAYVRYAYSHTAGTSAHLSSGETYDFNAVNSHRLRIGTRYTHGMTALSQFYAGLAWEYEFDGDARATSQGDSAPSPSLNGGSALLELGYRFAPQGSRMSYDLNLNGWQGKRKGVTGGVSVKWAF